MCKVVSFLFEDLQLCSEIAIRGEVDAKDAVCFIERRPLNDSAFILVALGCEAKLSIGGTCWCEVWPTFFPGPVNDVPGAFL